MAEEKDIKKTEGAEAPKKALKVVFRSQNSSSIKELPKGLRDAAGTKKQGEAAKKLPNGARPLPAGTKPVKPAVFGVTEEEKAETVQAVKEKMEAKAKAEKAENEKRKAMERTEGVVASGGVIIIKKAKAAEEAAAPEVKEETKKAEGEAPKKTEETAPKADVKPAKEAPIKEQPAKETPAKAEPKKAENKPAAKEAKKPESTVKSVLRKPEVPQVKILKSYANYDANAVIKQATEAQKAARKAEYAANRNKNNNNNNNNGNGSNGEDKGGRKFIARNPRNGEDRGGRNQNNGQNNRFSQQRPQGGQSPRFSQGGQSAPAGLDVHTGKNPQAKGRNAYSNKDKDRKDKYRDEPTQNIKKTGKGAFIKPEVKQQKPEDDIKVIVIPENLTIKDLADKLKVQPSLIIKKLFLQGKMVTPNSDLTYEEAEEIAMEYDILCEKEVPEDVIAELLKEEEEDEKDMVKRSPVVCVMGHVDHGKTSLLDAIRKTNVTSREAGGITQAIGASVVKINDRTITFLDTPGHEAFTAMRLRGAQSTDIAVLVVAADDGVKPQTVEAINHAKSAGVEVVVAINKIDKPDASIDRVKKELTEYELVAEEWGGSTPMVPVSAKSGEGIEDLLEIILLEADVLELKANPNREARGIVIEAQLDKGRGPVATVLVQKGTLRVGDNVAAGACYGKVRAMIDDKGNRVKKAGPSTPVEILGLNDVPNAGEVFMGCADEKEARNIADTFIAEHKKAKLEETKQKMNLNDLFDEIQAGNIKELPIIIKADVQGSVEAVKQSLGKMSNEEVAVKVIHAGVGNVNESDVSLASAANAIIIGFNVKPDPTAKSTAEHEKVDIRLYKVIYQAIDDLEAALTGMLAPTYEEKITGRAIVRQLFKASGVGTIAGSYVTDGVIERGSRARIYRGDKQIFDGNIASLKRFKDEVKEVKTGYECGLVFEDFGDLKEDDNVEIYKMVEVPRTAKKKD
ncbi:MAG: translation initiation factor IF-2 [Eubacteriales bacterium]|nr:translation initiation factor IF-2 [Eubacteriales bacterium]